MELRTTYISNCPLSIVTYTLDIFLQLLTHSPRRFNIRPRHYILPVFIFSVVYNIPRFFEWEAISVDYEVSCDDRNSDNGLGLVNGSLMDEGGNNSRTLESLEDVMMSEEEEEEGNCTKIVTNVTLAPRELRLHPMYIAVRRREREKRAFGN